MSWEIVGRVIREDPEYRASITALFGTVENPRGSVTAAIAEFERSLVTVDSPFDL